MSTSTDDTVDAGPNGQHLARRLAAILEDIPTLRESEIIDRHASPTQLTFRDEIEASLWADRYRPSAHELPGFGDIRDDPPCGTEIPHVCEDCGERVDVGRTCAQSRCPRCAPKWVIDRAYTKVSRIISAAKMKAGAQYKHHVAVGIPEDLFVDAEEPWDAILAAVQDFCREIDFDGVIIPHGYRGDHEGDFREGHTDDRGEWKERLFNGRSWHGDVREELKVSPHIHLIGACSWFPGGDVTKEIYERTGWIFHRITGRNGSAVSLGDMDAVARATTYALSHCVIDTTGEQNRAIYRTVGSAYHNADDRHHEEAKLACQKVAPQTLGIPSMEVECRNDLPKEDAGHDELEEYLDDAGDGEGEEPSSDAGDDGQQLVKCRGGLAGLHREETHEMIEDEDWQQTALHAEEAQATLEEWRDVGGWQQWVGQATLEDVDDPDVDADRPPPD